MDIIDEKQRIRKQLLKDRASISDEQLNRDSQKIIDQLQSLVLFKEAHAVHCYVSMNEQQEVSTHSLLKLMISDDKKVIVPETNFKDLKLVHRSLASFDDLKPNKWGVLEPENSKAVLASAIDLVIVPMVGADEQCNRMGYGKGFYDRFLKDLTVPKIGLNFEQTMVKELPVEAIDIPMDVIITERRIIKCN